MKKKTNLRVTRLIDVMLCFLAIACLLPAGCGKPSAEVSKETKATEGDKNKSQKDQKNQKQLSKANPKENPQPKKNLVKKETPKGKSNQPNTTPENPEKQLQLLQKQEEKLINTLQKKNPGYKPPEALMKYEMKNAEILCMVYSPVDSRLIAVSGLEKNAELLNLETGKVVVLQDLPARPANLAFTPDGKYVAVAAGNKVHLWNPVSNQVERTFDLKYGFEAVTVTGDGKSLIGGGHPPIAIPQTVPNLKQWDLHTGKETRTFPTQTSSVLTLAASGNGNWLAVGLDVGFGGKNLRRLALWNLKTKAEENTYLKKDFIRSLAFSPDNSTLAIGYSRADDTRGVSLIDLKSGAITPFGKNHDGGINALFFSPDGKYLFVGYTLGKGPALRIWELESGEVKGRFGSTVDVNGDPMALSPGGKILATRGFFERKLQIWRVADLMK